MSISCDLEGNGAVTFTIPEMYQIDTHSSVGGTITPGGKTKVSKGAKFDLAITPATGYKFLKLTDNGTDKTSSVAANKYSIATVAEDHDILVTFAEA